MSTFELLLNYVTTIICFHIFLQIMKYFLCNIQWLRSGLIDDTEPINVSKWLEWKHSIKQPKLFAPKWVYYDSCSRQLPFSLDCPIKWEDVNMNFLPIIWIILRNENECGGSNYTECWWQSVINLNPNPTLSVYYILI